MSPKKRKKYYSNNYPERREIEKRKENMRGNTEA